MGKPAARHWLPTLFLASAPLAAEASMLGDLSLTELVEGSSCILMVDVVQTGVPFPDGQKANFEGEFFVQVSSCRVLKRIKVSSDPADLVHQAFDVILIASPSKAQHGRLEQGKKYILFCRWGGFVPTVLNLSYIYEVREGKLDRAVVDPRDPSGETSLETATGLIAAIDDLLHAPGPGD